MHPKSHTDRPRSPRNRTYVLIGLIVLSISPLRGQAEEIRSITIGEAVRIALQENLDIKQFSNQVATSEVSVKQARANFYPNLSASVSGRKNFSLNNALTFDDPSSEALSTTISSNLNLFDGFNNIASLQKAKRDLAADEANFFRRRQLIMYETISQFLQVVLDRELIGVEKEDMESQQEQLRFIEEFYRAGNRSIADVLQQKADIAQSRLRVLNAERNYEVSRLTVLKTMGQAPTTPVEFIAPAIEQLVPTFVNLDTVRIADRALTLRPDIEAQKMEIEAARKQVQGAQSGYWPSVSLFANAGSNYSSADIASDFSEQLFDNNLNATVGLSLSIPLFDRLSTRNAVQQADIQLSNQELSLENLKLEMNFEVQQALLDFQTAVQQRAAAQAQLDYAQQAFEVSKARYTVGASTYAELTQARAHYVSAANDRVGADYGVLLRGMAIHYYLGDIDSAISMFE